MKQAITDEEMEMIDDENKHHLFSYYEIKFKLMQIHGKPNTNQEHHFLNNLTRAIWRKMPKFRIKKSVHDELHLESCKKCGISLGSIRKRIQLQSK